MRAAALQRAPLVLAGIAAAEIGRFAQRKTGRHVTVEQIVGRRLIGDGVGAEARVVELGELDRGVAFVADRDGFTRGARSFDFAQRLVARINQTVEIAQVAPALQAGAIDVDDQADAAVHRNRQRLRAAHSADAGRQT